MLKRKLTYGLSTVLLGMSLAAPASAECSATPTCGQNGGGGSESRAPVVSYDSAFYGFTTGVYGAVNLPFQSSDVTDMSIEPALPEGLQFNTATGGITGTPTTPTQGVSTFVIRAVNAAGQSGSTVIRIAVNPSMRASPTPEPSPSMAPVSSVTPSPSPAASPSVSPSPAVTQEETTGEGNGLIGRWISRLRAAKPTR
jgi:hypothetical protein